MEPMRCPICQAEIPEGELECQACAGAGDATVAFSRSHVLARRAEAAATAAQAAPAAGARKIARRVLVSPIIRRPVDIEDGAFITIGREKTNDVVFPSAHVSRVHAEVRCKGGVVTVSDLGSKNGTLVNGTRVLNRVLRDCDRITVGFFDLVYREVPEGEKSPGSDAPGAETAELVSEDEVFYGDLTRLSVVEVAQLLGQNRKTGTLTIAEATGGSRRRLHFVEGAIVHAEWDGTDGEGAVVPALRVREGKFSFRPGMVSRVSVTTSTERLIFEAARATAAESGGTAAGGAGKA